MKKMARKLMKGMAVWLLLAAGLGGTAVGQPTIIRIDTTLTPYFEFDYEAWLEADTHHPMIVESGRFYLLNSNGRGPGFIGDQVQYNYIEGGADVYGIAVWADLTTTTFGVDRYDTTIPMFPPNDLYFLDATPDSLVPLETVPFDNTVPRVHYNTMLWPLAISFDWSCASVHRSPDIRVPYLDMYSFYFEKPVHVDDSFYVGASNREFLYSPIINYYHSVGDYDFNPPYKIPGYGAIGPHSIGQDRYNGADCVQPPIKIKQRWSFPVDSPLAQFDVNHGAPPLNYLQDEWVNRESPEFWLILPIIGIYDTITTDDLPTCHEIGWFYAAPTTDNSVTLRWQAPDDHTEWQISYGPNGISPDEGTIVTCWRPEWRHTDTRRTDDTMVAWVRTVCREENYERHSEWSEAVKWCNGDCRHVRLSLPEGSAVVDGMVQLSPNPARGEVTVRSSYLLKGLEVFTQRGELYRSLDVKGLQSTFSVQGWPQGSYIVAVHTAAGTTTKKLIVQP